MGYKIGDAVIFKLMADPEAKFNSRKERILTLSLSGGSLTPGAAIVGHSQREEDTDYTVKAVFDSTNYATLLGYYLNDSEITVILPVGTLTGCHIFLQTVIPYRRVSGMLEVTLLIMRV